MIPVLLFLAVAVAIRVLRYFLVNLGAKKRGSSPGIVEIIG